MVIIIKMKKDEIKQKIALFSHKSVGIAGAGGLGSNVAVALARSGLLHLVVVDFDKVDESNLNRQYYFRSQVGKEKITALKENIENINSSVICDFQNIKLHKGSMWKPFQYVDIVVEALDSAEIKTQFIEEILQNLPNKPIVAASGVAGIGNSDRIYTKKLGNLYLVYDEEAKSSDEDILLAPKVCLFANWQANIVLELLSNEDVP
jgi:sulfur carrier protein ThiS adenylyltransferase